VGHVSVMPSSRLSRSRGLGGRHTGAVLLGWAAVAVGSRQDHHLARLHRAACAEPSPALVATPRVSILVAAWNEQDLIMRHIESVLALRYPHVEYVLCAGGTDRTYELAKRHEPSGIVVLSQRPGEGKQAALRRCLGRTTGEIVFLTDADCLLDDSSFERTIAPLINEGEAAATGLCRPLRHVAEAPPLVALQHCREIYGTLRAGRYSPGFLGRNCAIRRDVLTETGGLAAEAMTGTDYRLARSSRPGIGSGW
jgi:cellulose synthase/poly-beta-1,6-N-acetylglucosamine synthase-like glycosyltransferase